MFKNLLNSAIKFIVDNRPKLIRWILAGSLFMVLSTFFLYFFIDVCEFSTILATFLSAEVSTVLRYFVNSYWVFDKSRISFYSCWQYHLANASAFFVWWAVTNALIYMGMPYILAGILAVASSTLISLYTNFFWIWRKAIAKKSNRWVFLKRKELEP